MVLKQLDVHTFKNEPKHRPYTFQKNSEWTMCLSVKYRTIKLLGENLCDLGLVIQHKGSWTKKIDKLEFIKI